MRKYITIINIVACAYAEKEEHPENVGKNQNQWNFQNQRILGCFMQIWSKLELDLGLGLVLSANIR